MNTITSDGVDIIMGHINPEDPPLLWKLINRFWGLDISCGFFNLISIGPNAWTAGIGDRGSWNQSFSYPS